VSAGGGGGASVSGSSDTATGYRAR
jgi:hypothetical protein